VLCRWKLRALVYLIDAFARTPKVRRNSRILFRMRLYYSIVRAGRKTRAKRRQIIMGDKSPKSTQKNASQKQAKSSADSKKKNDASAAKQAEKGKK